MVEEDAGGEQGRGGDEESGEGEAVEEAAFSGAGLMEVGYVSSDGGLEVVEALGRGLRSGDDAGCGMAAQGDVTYGPSPF